MSDEIKGLMAQAPFSFVGTVTHLGAATTTDVPIDDHTAVVHVDHVLHAPEAFVHLEGHLITVQLSTTAEAVAVGQAFAFFVQGLSFGESLAVSEVGRLPVENVAEHANAAATAGKTGGAFDGLKLEIDQAALAAHEQTADAVVVGRVTGLEKAGVPGRSEHDPDWWCATIDVYHVERGAVSEGPLKVLYPNSLDVRWRHVPKPKAAQGGLWILHAAQGDQAKMAPFQIMHPEDFQPTQALDALRSAGG